MYQLDLIHIIVGVFGFVLIVNAIAVVVSSKYYSFFSKVYFVEPMSKSEKDVLARKTQRGDYNSQRYFSSILFVALGITAILWAFDVVKSVTAPFFILAAIALIVGALKCGKRK